MRGGAVFLAFFILFTLASLAVPAPLFPGSVIHGLLGLPVDIYGSLVDAIANGITYGLIVWLVFVVATRRLDESGVSDYRNRKRSSQRSSRKRSVNR